jgi:hypothetical protein
MHKSSTFSDIIGGLWKNDNEALFIGVLAGLLQKHAEYFQLPSKYDASRPGDLVEPS